MRQRPFKLRQASAYYRLAAKADRAGDYCTGRHYRAIADRRVAENQRDVAERKRRAS